MIVIDPIDFTLSDVVSTTLAPNDYPVYSDIVTYYSGDYVSYEGVNYELAVESSIGNPPTDTTKWVNHGAVNLMKAFGADVLTETVGNDFEITLRVSSLFNSISFFQVACQSIEIECAIAEGVYYTKIHDMTDYGVTNWYDYYFTPISKKTSAFFLDVPAYSGATVKIKLIGTGAKAGLILLGKQQFIGDAQLGSGVGIKDYSTSNNSIFNKVVDYSIKLPTSQFNTTHASLSKLLGKPAVYIANTDHDAFSVYGKYKNLRLIMSTNTLSDCSLKVEGLNYD